ncbi:MAG: ABC transporter permease subunit, partial [Oxalobacteraceae bacterium]
AAKMDGAGPWALFFRIILPNSRPVIATAAIVLFIAASSSSGGISRKNW